VRRRQADVEAGRLADGRSVGAGLELDELLEVRGEALGDRDEDARALVRKLVRPDAGLERAPGRLDGAVGVGHAALGDGRDELLVGRVADLVGLVGVDPLPVDQHLMVLDADC
jgi:hypothetical protein